MKVQDCLQLLRKLKDVAFATVDEQGLPQVRIIDVMLVEEEKLYFCTARGKNFYHQLVATGRVAITGMNAEFQMVRLTGAVEKLAEQKVWIDRIFEENPVMKGVYPGASRYILEAFCINPAEIEFFDLGKTPIYRETFATGTAPKPLKGFLITTACTGCGKCQKICPQQCIIPATPCQIKQENCLHCGLCREACPARAIVRRGE